MAEPTFEWVSITLLRRNAWNPNAMDEDMFGKAVESIHQFGFIDPVTVRTISEGLVDTTTFEESAHGERSAFLLDWLEIIDGEHRWKAAKEHSGACVKGKGGTYTLHVPMDRIPVTNLGHLPDSIAKQLTIVLNETRGTFDPKRMGALLTDLVTIEPLPVLLNVLPFSKEKFYELAELPSVDWDAIETTKPASTAGRDERWVERVYRMPAEAAEIFDEAVRAARDEPGAPDWRGLQTIAEHFLGT